MAMKDRDLAKALHLVELRNISPESLAEKIAGCIKSARKKAIEEERARHRPLVEANYPEATCTCGIGEGGISKHIDCPTAKGLEVLRDDPPDVDLVLRAVAEEREACARAVYDPDDPVNTDPEWTDRSLWLYRAAEAVRDRGRPEEE